MEKPLGLERKPPLGLAPRWLREEQRADEITAAISRYEKEGFPVPEEWLEEMRYLQGRAVVRQSEAAVDEGLEAMESRAAIYREKKAVCIDSRGDSGLTERREYEILGISGGLVRVANDAGEVREYFMERFR
jgi:hypothetical protein